jgi:hypothetical protein
VTRKGFITFLSSIPKTAKRAARKQIIGRTKENNQKRNKESLVISVFNSRLKQLKVGNMTGEKFGVRNRNWFFAWQSLCKMKKTWKTDDFPLLNVSSLDIRAENSC